MCHEFFDELRIEGSLLPNGRDLPTLFDFTREGETAFLGNFLRSDAVPELSTRPDLIRQLVPSHAEPALRAQGIDIDGFVPIPLEQLRISLDVSENMVRESFRLTARKVNDSASCTHE